MVVEAYENLGTGIKESYASRPVDDDVLGGARAAVLSGGAGMNDSDEVVVAVDVAQL